MSSFFVYSTEMVFCYEDKELPPSYMGNGLVVPKERPGAAIEILRRADKLLENISIKYVRKPWQRCLYELKKNKIDAVIASYRPERRSFMAFPLTQDDKLNKSMAISRFGRCLIGKSTFFQHVQMRERALSLAVPSGYSSVSSIDTGRFAIVHTRSQTEAFDLVVKDVVNGSIGLCLINGEKVEAYPYSQELEAIYPPFDMSFGFLVYSKAFYNEYHSEADALSKILATIPAAQLYMDYLEPKDIVDRPYQF